jgi:hypothetical protein
MGNPKYKPQAEADIKLQAAVQLSRYLGKTAGLNDPLPVIRCPEQRHHGQHFLRTRFRGPVLTH